MTSVVHNVNYANLAWEKNKKNFKNIIFIYLFIYKRVPVGDNKKTTINWVLYPIKYDYHQHNTQKYTCL